jgi:hypothetical protein
LYFCYLIFAFCIEKLAVVRYTLSAVRYSLYACLEQCRRAVR